jgi:hypothetical protein
MNKIEQYKFDTVVGHHVVGEPADLPSYLEGYEKGWDEGFDHCMSLELPVKFAEWIRTEEYFADEDGWYENAFTEMAIKHTTQELFNYWLENVWSYEK